MKNYILAVVAGLVLAGNSFASESMLLTDAEMDNVSAGVSVTILQSGAALGLAATAGSSSVLGIAIPGFALAAGAGDTAGASQVLGAWSTSNRVIANP